MLTVTPEARRPFCDKVAVPRGAISARARSEFLAKSYQTFRKRERENKLRERALLKRQSRQRSQEAKKSQVETAAAPGQLGADKPASAD